MIETLSDDYILTLSGNGLGFLYNSMSDCYTAAGLPVTTVFGTTRDNVRTRQLLADAKAMPTPSPCRAGA